MKSVPHPQAPDVSKVERSFAVDAQPAAATARARVCFPFVGDSLGGSHMSALLLIEGLVESGYESVIVVHEEGPLTDHLAGRGLPYELLPLSGYAGETPSVPAIAAAMLRNAPRLATYMKRHRIDIVHGNDLRMNLTWSAAAKLTGRPFVWHQRALPNSSSALWYAISLLSDHTIHISNATSQAMPRMGRKPTSVVRNPVKLPHGMPSRVKSKGAVAKHCGLDPATRIIGFVGRLVTWKRPDVFLAAAAYLAGRVSDIALAFVMVGDDKEGLEHGLRQQAISLGIEDKVHFIGFRHPIEEWIAGMDLLMATSEREPFGRTLIEAMALGTPVVAAAAAGHIEIIEHERTGLLVTPNDAAAIAAAAHRVLTQPAFAAGLSEAGRACAAERYSTGIHVNRICSIYDSLL